METITYNLKPENNNSSFYNELSGFTDTILNNLSTFTVKKVNRFIHFVKKKKKKEAIGSFNDYYLEYLTMGVLLNKYDNRALATSKVLSGIIKWLYNNRSKNQNLKPHIDKARGILATLFLTRQKRGREISNLKNFQRFINWLEASGEFPEEVIRLKAWQIFFTSLSRLDVADYIKSSKEIAMDFEKQAKARLGSYTKRVASFRKEELPEHRFKENYFFCGRYEVEYHLNMVGAEILNRSLQREFSHTTSKVLLLPTCMSKPANGQCKANYSGLKISCTGCTHNCNINRRRIEYAKKDIEVALIPHSSGFSKFLEYWKNQHETGLIGVACVLNLLKGGYEMKKLNIPSQCVFLDYCGCKKHWHKDGIPTDFNINRLNTLIG